MKTVIGLLSFLIVVFQSNHTNAAPKLDLVGLATDGTIYQIDVDTGALTTLASEQLHSFSLGAIVRRKSKLYYVATPSGGSENSIYTADLTSKTISHIDLDKAAGDDEVRALFIKGNFLFGIFYNGTAGTAGLYRINPLTGQTTLQVDFSALNVEPIGGALAHFGTTAYVIVKSETDNSVRSLLSFKPAKKTVQKIIPITDVNGAPVACERIKINLPRLNFTCLAAPTTTQVNVCSVRLNGKAVCRSTLSDVERVAGGHTLMTPNGKDYYALVYAPGDQNSQRLVQFTANGKLKDTQIISSIIIGARFGQDEPSS